MLVVIETNFLKFSRKCKIIQLKTIFAEKKRTPKNFTKIRKQINQTDKNLVRSTADDQVYQEKNEMK